MVGSSVTTVVLPLLLIVQLRVGAAQIGWLRALLAAPYLILALPSGLLADRLRRRPVMIASDLGRAGLLSTIAILLFIGKISVSLVLIIAVGASCLTVLFDVCATSALLDLVTLDEVSSANAALQTSSSASELIGPTLGGALVSISGGIAVAADAATFVISAFSLLRIKSQEERPEPIAHEDWRAGLLAGALVVWRNPILRRLTAYLGLVNIAAQAFLTVAFVYFIHSLGFAPVTAGAVFSFGGLGLALGASVANRIALVAGVGRAILVSAVADAAGLLVVGLAPSTAWWRLPVACLGLLSIGFADAVWNIHNVSIRQKIVSPLVLGRVTAAVRLVAFGTMPIGALCGGWLASEVGPRQAILIAAAVSAGAAVILRDVSLGGSSRS